MDRQGYLVCITLGNWIFWGLYVHSVETAKAKGIKTNPLAQNSSGLEFSLFKLINKCYLFFNPHSSQITTIGVAVKIDE